MRIVYTVAFLLAAGPAFAAMPAPDKPGFVKGHTTVAEAQQSLGAPMDTVMGPNGALTLIYPADRFAERASAGAPHLAAFVSHANLKPHAVALQFARDFTYQGASTETPGTGLASR
jgi:hypothetical protein